MSSMKMTTRDRSVAKKKQVYEVKLIDKISFTLGVFCICSTEWMALRRPDWFPLYYLAIMTSLLVWRLITYTREKNQLFMLGGSTSSTLLNILKFLFRFLLLHEPLVSGTDLPRHVQHCLVQGKTIV